MASRPLRTSAIALACSLLIGACGGGGDDPEVADGSARTSTTAAEEPSAEAPAEVAPELTVDGAPAPTETPTAAPLRTAPSPPAAGSSAQAASDEGTEPFRPAPGLYRYEGEGGGERTTSTVRVEDMAPEAGGFRVKQTSVDQEGFGQVREILWSVSGVRVDRQHNASPDEESGRCDWQPDFVQYVFPLDVGRRWDVSTTCRSTDPTRPGSLTQKSTARVTERRSVTVGGVTTTVFVIERSGTTTLGAAGVTVVRRRASTELWSPRYGLVVEESGTTATDTPGEDRPPTPFRNKLLNLRPE
jgi:hypothetical protein